MAQMMEGKAGLVTASGSGIGRASAIALANAGAKVMISDVSEEAGKETVKMITDNGGKAQFLKCDVSDENQVKALVTFYSIKHEVNAMIETGGGAIVNTASGSGVEGSPNMTPYTASKHGVVGLTKSVALEYGKQGIRINSIAPGATITPSIERWAEDNPEQYEGVLDSLPAGEMATPADQVNAVMFLCSDLAKQISGGYHSCRRWICRRQIVTINHLDNHHQ